MATDWLQRIADDGAVRRLTRLIEQGGGVSARGAVGSSTLLVVAALQRLLNRPVVLVVAHLDEADEAPGEVSRTLRHPVG